MNNLEPNIRLAVRALIRQGQSVLVQHKIYEDGTEHYVLPGGGPNNNETLEQGLVRECLEEIGVQVQVKKLLFVADFYKARKTSPPSTRHQLEIIFACEVPDDYEACNGPDPDKHQVDVIWLENPHLSEHFWPARLGPHIADFIDINASDSTMDKPVYLGLIS